jgi:hypothetical protein
MPNKFSATTCRHLAVIACPSFALAAGNVCAQLPKFKFYAPICLEIWRSNFGDSLYAMVVGNASHFLWTA